MKKHFSFLLMALFAMTGLTFTSCSEDDDKNPGAGGPLAGTSWKVISSTDPYDYPQGGEDETEDDYLVGATITFKTDGTAVYSNNYFDWAAWKYDNGTLKIGASEEPGYIDDVMVGSIVFSGNTATYTYHWENEDSWNWSGRSDDEWIDDEEYTLVLQKI